MRSDARGSEAAGLAYMTAFAVHDDMVVEVHLKHKLMHYATQMGKHESAVLASANLNVSKSLAVCGTRIASQIQNTTATDVRSDK